MSSLVILQESYSSAFAEELLGESTSSKEAEILKNRKRKARNARRHGLHQV